MRRPPLPCQATYFPTARSTKQFNVQTGGEKMKETTRVESRRDDVEPQRATRFTSALRLCISGCVCSTKRSLLSVFVAPERDLRPHERSFGAKRARAPFRAQLRPAPSSFSTQDRLLLIQLFFHFLLLYPMELDSRSDSKEATCSDEGEIIWGSYVNLFRLIQKLRKKICLTAHCSYNFI